MEKEIIDKLIDELKLLIGGKVEKAMLVTWPYLIDDWDKIEFVLNLKITIISNEFRNITFRMYSDGQTPIIVNEKIEYQYELSELSSRIEQWKTFDTLPMNGECYHKYESFNIEYSEEYAGVVGSTIVKVGVYYLQDKKYFFFQKEKPKDPFGLFLEFSSGKKIWVVCYCDTIWTGNIYPKWIFDDHKKYLKGVRIGQEIIN